MSRFLSLYTKIRVTSIYAEYNMQLIPLDVYNNIIEDNNNNNNALSFVAFYGQLLLVCNAIIPPDRPGPEKNNDRCAEEDCKIRSADATLSVYVYIAGGPPPPATTDVSTPSDSAGRTCFPTVYNIIHVVDVQPES